MYDAKDNNVKTIHITNNLKNGCIGDRSYFMNVQKESLMNFKSSYVPTEKIIKME